MGSPGQRPSAQTAWAMRDRGGRWTKGGLGRAAEAEDRGPPAPSLGCAWAGRAWEPPASHASGAASSAGGLASTASPARERGPATGHQTRGHEYTARCVSRCLPSTKTASHPGGEGQENPLQNPRAPVPWDSPHRKTSPKDDCRGPPRQRPGDSVYGVLEFGVRKQALCFLGTGVARCGTSVPAAGSQAGLGRVPGFPRDGSKGSWVKTANVPCTPSGGLAQTHTQARTSLRASRGV